MRTRVRLRARALTLNGTGQSKATYRDEVLQNAPRPKDHMNLRCQVILKQEDSSQKEADSHLYL
jgi:hypothetical protein